MYSFGCFIFQLSIKFYPSDTSSSSTFDLSRSSVLHNGLSSSSSAILKPSAAESSLAAGGTSPAGAHQLNMHTSATTTPPLSTVVEHLLYVHGRCAWPSCDMACTSLDSFARHLNEVHNLDDKSTAQCRVQMQVKREVKNLSWKFVKYLWSVNWEFLFFVYYITGWCETWVLISCTVKFYLSLIGTYLISY